MKAADPNAVIATARSWLGTPYHDQASLRGVGCDCLGLARGLWRELVGPEPFPIPPYSRDWGETGPREVLAEGARRMMIEVEPAAAEPGALVLFRMKPRAIAKHVGIGLVLGVAEVMMQVVLPESMAGFRDAFIFTAVGVLLLVRPQGILGERPDFGEKS